VFAHKKILSLFKVRGTYLIFRVTMESHHAQSTMGVHRAWMASCVVCAHLHLFTRR